MASPEEALSSHWEKGRPHRKKLSVATGRGNDLTGRSSGLSGRKSLYLLEEEMASPEEALCTHWEKRWPHRKKLFITALKKLWPNRKKLSLLN
jgi:hypothetical protein